jgi:hypothetical protein
MDTRVNETKACECPCGDTGFANRRRLVDTDDTEVAGDVAGQRQGRHARKPAHDQLAYNSASCPAFGS